jgi:hypothetical protein
MILLWSTMFVLVLVSFTVDMPKMPRVSCHFKSDRMLRIIKHLSK